MFPNENSDIVSFGDWLRERRRSLDLTQVALAQKVGCAVVTIKKIEHDERRPSRQMAELLADSLAIPTSARHDFIRMARGELGASLHITQPSIRPPVFLQRPDPPVLKEPPLFVNRKRELAQLKTHLNKTVAGSGRAVFIRGGAGQGKSSLMIEFSRQAQLANPSLVALEGHCNTIAGAGDPYLPFRDIFGMLTGDLEARWSAGTISQEQTLRLWSFLPDTIQALLDYGPDLIDSLIAGPPLLRRLTMSMPERVDWSEAVEALIERQRAGTIDLEQGRFLDEVTEILKSLAFRRPLLLLLDDLQWIDDASMNLFFHLGRRLSGCQILLLGAYRSGELKLNHQTDGPDQWEQPLLEPVITELKRYFGDIELNLDEQTTAERQGFIEALVDSEPNKLPDSFRERLFLHTRGHPLFTVEMLRSMQADGTIIRDPDGQWVENMAVFPQKLPVRVEAVIEHRINRIDKSLQAILEVACVEGELFTAQIVARVLGQDEQLILQRLDRELEYGLHLVREQPEVTVNGQTLNRYRFEHGLFQEYFYRRMGQGEQRLYHRQVAQALETIFEAYTLNIISTILNDSEQVGEVLDRPYPDCIVEFGPSLAHHFWQGHGWGKAAAYNLCVGVGAMKVYAVRDAIAAFDRAIKAVENLTDPPYELVFETIIRWEDAAFNFKPYTEQLEKLALAEQIARRQDDVFRLIQTLYRTANVHLARGLWMRAGPALMECLGLTQSSGYEPFSVRPVYFQALMTTYANPREALTLLVKSKSLAHKYKDQRIETLSLGSMAQMQAYLGEFNQAMATMQQAYKVLGKDESPLTESDLDLLSGWTYLTMGDIEQGLAYGLRSVEKAIATDNMDCICYGFDCVGFANLEMQRIADAESAFNEAIQRSETSGAIIPQLLGRAGLAMTQFFKGQREIIFELESVLEAMKSYNDYIGVAEVTRMLGVCAMQMGKLDRAEDYLDTAIDFYRRMEMRPYLVRSLETMVQLYNIQDRSVKAQAVQKEAETLMAIMYGSV